jgi:hypothetical protein
MLSNMAEGPGAGASVGLIEHALKRLEAALHRVDDSDGAVGDLIAQLQSAHLAACERLRPDPTRLAERLFRWELDGDWDVFRGAAETYAGVLGESGLATYRKLAEAEWAVVPVVMPARDGGAGSRSDSFNITYMMRSLARAYGDEDMEVAVLERDLSTAYRFLEIARVLRSADRRDEALAWAERGLRQFAARPDGRMREFVAEEYLLRSRDDDALALIWAEFADRPTIETYQSLKRFSERIGAWPDWRSKALDLARQAAERIAQRWGYSESDIRERSEAAVGSTLVELLLSDGDLNEALAAARRLGCHSHLWLALAAQLKEMRPADALEVYLQQVKVALGTSDRRSYGDAIALLTRAGHLFDRLGRHEEFVDYAGQVRAANSRRPAFLELFDRAGLGVTAPPDPTPAVPTIGPSAPLPYGPPQLRIVKND